MQGSGGERARAIQAVESRIPPAGVRAIQAEQRQERAGQAQARSHRVPHLCRRVARQNQTGATAFEARRNLSKTVYGLEGDR